VDGTGFITIENLVEAMGSQEHVEEIIAEVDQDHDGRIR
jgi:Ca2+-binding EF-hand superfamily protein